MMEHVVRAWQLSEDLHARDGVSSDEHLEQAERALGRPLPDQLRALYSVAGSGAYFGGMLVIDPLLPAVAGGLSLAANPAFFASLDPSFPSELLIFGGNGGGDLFGIWLPARSAGPTPVVRHTEDFGDPPYAIVGEDLGRFLTGYTALQLCQEQLDPEDPSLDLTPALDALDVPAALRDDESADEVAFLAWSSPSAPTHGAYLRSLDAQEIRAFVEGS